MEEVTVKKQITPARISCVYLRLAERAPLPPPRTPALSHTTPNHNTRARALEPCPPFFTLRQMSGGPGGAGRRENALDLAKFVDNGVRVKLSGGREGERKREREAGAGAHGTPISALSDLQTHPSLAPNPPPTVEGVLKGYDQLLNLVLDEAVEYLRDRDDLLRVTDDTRALGLCVLRGTSVMAVAPTAGSEVLVSNPFAGAEEAAE